MTDRSPHAGAQVALFGGAGKGGEGSREKESPTGDTVPEGYWGMLVSRPLTLYPSPHPTPTSPLNPSLAHLTGTCRSREQKAGREGENDRDAAELWTKSLATSLMKCKLF